MSIITTLRATRTASTNGGVTFPQDLLDEVTRYEDAAKTGVPQVAFDGLVNAVGLAALAGKDPSADPGVLKALARHQLATAVGSWDRILDDWAGAHIVDILADHADALFDAWGTAITAAGETIADALPHLDRASTLPEQAEAALRGGPRRAKAWQDAHAAVTVVNQLATAQTILGTQALNVLGNVPALRTVLRCIAVTAAQFDKIPRTDASDVWALAAVHELTIAGGNLDDIQGAMARIARERQDAETARGERNRHAASAPFRIR